MVFTIRDIQGNLVATYFNGKLTLLRPLEKTVLGLEVFGLLTSLMNVGGGASYGTPLQPAEVELDQGEA